MKRIVAVALTTLMVSSLDGCGSTSEGTEEASGGGTGQSGGVMGSGGTTSSSVAATGGAEGTGGVQGTGGSLASGGRPGTGGRSGGGATGTQTGACPYTAASFSCEEACQKLHEFHDRCQDDPSVPAELQGMLGIYGAVEVICTSTCAVVAPSSQAQWSCFQGIPADAPCAALAGCNATNCP